MGKPPASTSGYAKRNADIKRIHAMARELALTDDCYRALISGVSAGRTESSKALSSAERRTAIVKLQALGAGRKRNQMANTPEARKARALWMALWFLGELTDGSESAFQAFAVRQTGVDHLAWMRGEDASRVIDALKAMCERAGYRAPATAGCLSPKAVAVLMDAKRQLVREIWRRLGGVGVLRLTGQDALDAWISHRIAGHKTGVELLGGTDLDAAAIGLGQWLRRVMEQKAIEPPLSTWLRRHREAVQ